MLQNQVDAPSLAFRRKVVTTITKIQCRYPESPPPHHEDPDFDLKPNLHLTRSTFPIITTQTKSYKITKNASPKPLMVLSKQNIDYGALFQKKMMGMKGSKTTSFLSSTKQQKQIKERQFEEPKVKAKVSPGKHFQRKRQSLIEQRIDICEQTISMMKGMGEKDLNAFILLLNQSEQQRKKKANERWKTFNTEKFIKIYSKQYFG